MGTRAHIEVYDGAGRQLVSIYKHWDGYPEGLGVELREWAAGMRLVNGLRDDGGRVWNGPGCMAADLVRYLKRGPGDVYLADHEDDGGAMLEYVYRLDCRDGDERPHLTITYVYLDRVEYDGPCESFVPEKNNDE